MFPLPSDYLRTFVIAFAAGAAAAVASAAFGRVMYTLGRNEGSRAR